METLIYENKIPTSYRKDFIAKVRSIAMQLEIEPDWLMLVMNSESAGSFSSSIKNSIGCIGLIQFCPDEGGGRYKTIRGRKYYMSEIQNMSPIEQLDLVYNFYYPYRNKIESFYDLYLVTFYPYAMGKPDSYIFGSEVSEARVKKIAAQNRGIDMDKNGIITMKDFRKYTDSKLPLGFKSEVDMSVKLKKFTFRNSWQILAFGVIPIGLGIFIYYRKLK